LNSLKKRAILNELVRPHQEEKFQNYPRNLKNKAGLFMDMTSSNRITLGKIAYHEAKNE
jgi:hypothetical protein